MPQELKVQGFMLKPYCLRHQMTLQAIDHPLVHNRVPEPDELVMAYRVCSSHDGIEALKNPPTLKEKWFNARMVASPAYHAESLSAFMKYCEDYSSQPKYWEKADENEIKKESIPSQLLMVSILLCKTSLTEEEIWRMPIGKLAWYGTAVSVIEGGDIETLSTEIEENAERDLAFLRKLEAEQLAKHKKE